MRRPILGTAAVAAVAASAAVAVAVNGNVTEPVGAAQQAGGRQNALMGAFFSNPDGPPAERNRLVQHLLDLIGGAAVGSEIRVSAYQLRTNEVPDALLAAAHRGVKVKVVADSLNNTTPEEGGYESFRLLAKTLGKDKSKPSWLMTCTEGKACIGTAGTPFNHNKFFLFSETSGLRDVVVQSTANQATTVGGLAGWNSTYAVAGNTGLYAEYGGYFNDLAAMKKSNDYYNVRTPKAHGNIKTYFHPRATGDTVVNYLNYVKCFGSTQGGTSDNHRTIIRISMWSINRPAVAKKLWELDSQGCYVDIVADSIEDTSRAELLKPAGGYHGPEIRLFTKAGKGVHEKNMLIDGVYNGAINQKIVFTGTHNMNPSSLRQNDETTLKINDAGLHDQFRQNFRDVRTKADCELQTSTLKADPKIKRCEEEKPSAAEDEEA